MLKNKKALVSVVVFTLSHSAMGNDSVTKEHQAQRNQKIEKIAKPRMASIDPLKRVEVTTGGEVVVTPNHVGGTLPGLSPRIVLETKPISKRDETGAVGSMQLEADSAIGIRYGRAKLDFSGAPIQIGAYEKHAEDPKLRRASGDLQVKDGRNDLSHRRLQLNLNVGKTNLQGVKHFQDKAPVGMVRFNPVALEFKSSVGAFNDGGFDNSVHRAGALPNGYRKSESTRGVLVEGRIGVSPLTLGVARELDGQATVVGASAYGDANVLGKLTAKDSLRFKVAANATVNYLNNGIRSPFTGSASISYERQLACLKNSKNKDCLHFATGFRAEVMSANAKTADIMNDHMNPVGVFQLFAGLTQESRPVQMPDVPTSRPVVSDRAPAVIQLKDVKDIQPTVGIEEPTAVDYVESDTYSPAAQADDAQAAH